MKRFGWHVGQRIVLRGTIYNFNLELNIVGTIAGHAPPSFLLFRRDYLEEAAGEPGFVAIYWVKVDQSSSVPEVIAALDERFANSSAETLSESEAAFIGGFMDSYRLFFRLAEGLGVIVLVTIGLVAANTAAMSIRDRRSEIAVMRAMGFPSRIILPLIIGESVLIASLGGLLGCGAAYLTFKLFHVGTDTMGPLSNIRISPAVIAETLVLAVLLGISSALVPAYATLRRTIADALRSVG
jgi:putative ABC transport system permease protein